MRVWSLLTGAFAMALLMSGSVEARCSTIHQESNWIVVRDGADAVEYRAESQDPDWRVLGVSDVGIFCPTCGQVRFSSSSDADMSILQRLQAFLGSEFRRIDRPYAIKLGPLKGEAQRFRSTSSGRVVLDAVVLEAGDGCVTASLFVQDNVSLDSSPFRSAKAITEATVLKRIPRGSASSFDIRCAKSRMLYDFAMFKVWAGVEDYKPWQGSPAPTPSHEDFMRGLQLKP
jgi:hypothetical protein